MNFLIHDFSNALSSDIVAFWVLINFQNFWIITYLFAIKLDLPVSEINPTSSMLWFSFDLHIKLKHPANISLKVH